MAAVFVVHYNRTRMWYIIGLIFVSFHNSGALWTTRASAKNMQQTHRDCDRRSGFTDLRAGNVNQGANDVDIDIPNLSDHLRNADPALNSIVLAVARATTIISGVLEDAPIQGLLGYRQDGMTTNESGDKQKKIDIIADDIMRQQLSACACIDVLATEESKNPIYLMRSSESWVSELSTKYAQCRIVVAYDPLDGSSNIDCNVPTGTIFGVYAIPKIRELERKGEGSQVVTDFCTGRYMIAAGYALYSSSTEFVFSLGENRTIGFTLNPRNKQFYMTRPSIVCPTRGPFYSLNDGRSPDWPTGLQRYIDDIKNSRSQWKKQYSSRYICSLVADVHRTLLYGGWAGNPRAHLRLLYEAAPLAFVATHAGGLGSDGVNRLLDVSPTSLHHRLPVFIGSALDIEELESYGDVQQLSTKKC